MAKTASLRHIFVIQLFTLAAAVRPPSEARGAEAWDRAQTALRQVRMYDTMLSGYSMLSTTSHTLGLLPCASVDGCDMRSSVPQNVRRPPKCYNLQAMEHALTYLCFSRR